MNNHHNDGRDDLFLDNEDEPDEDQISGSGDRPLKSELKRPDVDWYDSSEQNGSDRNGSDWNGSDWNGSKKSDRKQDRQAAVRQRVAAGRKTSQKTTATIR